MVGCLFFNVRVEVDWWLYFCFLIVILEVGLKCCLECRECKGYENVVLVVVGGIRNFMVFG